MRLEWIEDILAVLDCGSLARAAEKRFLTQSAFTRRVRMIEDNIGTVLFDRSRKPVTLMPGVVVLEPELRDLAARLRRVKLSLKEASEPGGMSIRVACQHALTTTISPSIVEAVAIDGRTIRVRSGNRDECLMLLLTGDVDIAITYEVPGDSGPAIPAAFETADLGDDILIPVCAPQMLEIANSGDLPVISYPSDVYLGQVFYRAIAPRIPDSFNISPKAETALTFAMIQFALKGQGAAWLPYSLVSDELGHDRLASLSNTLPVQPLSVKMVRVPERQSEHIDPIWHLLSKQLRMPSMLQGVPDEPPGAVQSV